MAKIESMAPSGAPYVDGPDRDPYIGRPMLITRVIDDPANHYGPRWVVEVGLIDSGEVIALGLTKNPYRDRQLAGVRAALDDGEDIDPVILFRDEEHKGKNNQAPWAFRSATDAEIEAAGRIAAGEDDNADEPAPAKGRGK